MITPLNAFIYARDTVRGRWLEGESIILTNPHLTCEYARDVIKGRWKDAELIISDAHAAWYDAEHIILSGKEGIDVTS